MSTYKLTYFNGKGAAETARFVFAQAGVKYEDVRLEWEGEEWIKLKPNTPTGKLPLLEVDGKQMPGSLPITRYLAEKFGLAGSNDFENGLVAAAVDVVTDFSQKLVKVHFEKDEARKTELQKTFMEEDIPSYWGIIENFIKKNNSDDGWVFGNKPTYADFLIYNTLEYIFMGYPETQFAEKFPGVYKLKQSVAALPNIDKWLKERPVTEH